FFETISLGVHLAISMNPSLNPGIVDIGRWLNDPKFKTLVSTERKTHEQKKMMARIEYVRDHLLEKTK
ncbi:MAG: hypothetical protein NTY70_18585, partial [Burkholderiales bacterium]|nr:hypothetical protein [Burkholderiales bacterium]